MSVLFVLIEINPINERKITQLVYENVANYENSQIPRVVVSVIK